MYKSFLPLFFLIVSMFGCKKTERKIEHENYIVEGANQIPPYRGVTSLQISNYVNKMNIDLLGVEAEDEQLNLDVSFLKENDLSEDSRTTIIARLQLSSSYYNRFVSDSIFTDAGWKGSK